MAAPTDVAETDPLRVVRFEDADPVFALAENVKKPMVLRAGDAALQKSIADGRIGPGTSVAAAPLVSGDLTTGLLGFVKSGDREWKAEELNALEAIASLFAQVQARVRAEERLRYLADHDDLTGLQNRRSLIQHLDARLSAGSPGPVHALYFDLDRLKTINDYLGHSAGDWFIRVVAERLREGTDDASVIARLGGDEFVVIPGAPLSATRRSPPRRSTPGAVVRTRRDRRRDAHQDREHRRRLRDTGPATPPRICSGGRTRRFSPPRGPAETR